MFMESKSQSGSQRKSDAMSYSFTNSSYFKLTIKDFLAIRFAICAKTEEIERDPNDLSPEEKEKIHTYIYVFASES